MKIHFVKNIARVEILKNGIPMYEKGFGFCKDLSFEVKVGDIITIRDPSGWGYGGLVNHTVERADENMNISFTGFFIGRFVIDIY